MRKELIRYSCYIKFSFETKYYRKLLNEEPHPNIFFTINEKYLQIIYTFYT